MGHKYTQQEMNEIRMLFIGGFPTRHPQPKGILQDVVNKGRAKNPDIKVNPSVLKAFYQMLDCQHVAILVDVIEELNPKSLGSNSLDFLQVTRGPYTVEAGMTMQAVHIGNPKTQTSPLQWLTYLMEGFSELTSLQMEAFDTICGELLLMADSRSVTSVDFPD